MAITYTIDETFNGKRTTQVPDPDNEGQMKSVETTVNDIMVTFKSDDPAIEQSMNPIEEHYTPNPYSLTNSQSKSTL